MIITINRTLFCILLAIPLKVSFIAKQISFSENPNLWPYRYWFIHYTCAALDGHSASILALVGLGKLAHQDPSTKLSIKWMGSVLIVARDGGWTDSSIRFYPVFHRIIQQNRLEMKNNSIKFVIFEHCHYFIFIGIFLFHLTYIK